MSLRGNVPKLGMIACLCHYILLLLNKKVHENKFVANLKVIFVFLISEVCCMEKSNWRIYI